MMQLIKHRGNLSRSPTCLYSIIQTRRKNNIMAYNCASSCHQVLHVYCILVRELINFIDWIGIIIQILNIYAFMKPCYVKKCCCFRYVILQINSLNEFKSNYRITPTHHAISIFTFKKCLKQQLSNNLTFDNFT